MVLARRFEEFWYIAGINGEDSKKQITLHLDFLRDQKKGLMITDGEDNRSFHSLTIQVDPKKPFDVTMIGNGGFVIKL